MSREEDYERWPDACVAVAIFGWRWFESARSTWIAREPEWVLDDPRVRTEPPEDVPLSFAKNLPAYTSDASADYTVLERVRETWDDIEQVRLFDALHELWCGVDEGKRYGFGKTNRCTPMNYLPGDYSRAALSVLKEKAGGHRG